MSNTDLEGGLRSREPNLTLLDGEVVEFPLLLAGWQAAAVEATARSRGLTAGQMIRQLIQDYFARFAQPRSA